jgi:Zn-dependent peptidase ImmA (M78 family)
MKKQHEPSQLAEDLRREWGIDNYAPIDIFNIVNENMPNLTLIFSPLDDKISGCCSKIYKEQVILINSNHPKGRQNFTLAHEIYHLLYEDNDEWLICSIDENENPSEKKADKFASSLLMPNSALRDYKKRNKVKKWSLDKIISCEQFFKISHIAMLCRLRRLNSITYDEYKDYKPNVKQEAMKLGYSTELYEPSIENKKYFSLGNYIRLTEKAYENGKISIGKRNELLNDVYRSDIVYNIKEEDFEKEY